MDEYISREELRKHLKECYDNELFDADMRKVTFGIDVYVENMPTADVQPVKHGQWIVDEHGYLRCDNCGEVCLRNDIGIYVKSWYCPECGADMRLRGDND